jgi:hypothetical protein
MRLPDERIEPRSYEVHKQRILARLSEAQRKWERKAGARLVVSPVPPYFSYTADCPEGARRSAA